MSYWEGIEFELARVYTVFAGDPDGAPLQAEKGYGAGRIFQERLKILQEIADKCFRQRPHQHLEGEFDQLTSAVIGFSDRRNEVAHGMVMPIQKLSFFMERFGQLVGGNELFLLIPPLHTIRKHTEGLPKYAYSSVELKELSDRLILLWGRASDFRKAFLARQAGSPQGPP